MLANFRDEHAGRVYAMMVEEEVQHVAAASRKPSKFIFLLLLLLSPNDLSDIKFVCFEIDFIATNLGCCGTGFIEMGPLCNSAVPLCPFPYRFIYVLRFCPSISEVKFKQ